MPTEFKELKPKTSEVLYLALSTPATTWEAEAKRAEHDCRPADAAWCRYMLDLRNVDEARERGMYGPPVEMSPLAQGLLSVLAVPFLAILCALMAALLTIAWPFAPFIVYAVERSRKLKNSEPKSEA